MVPTETGFRNYFSDVYYIPPLHNYIISFGQLMKKGYDICLYRLYN